MTSSDRPISEDYRLVAKQWVEADGAARMMEECKTATLSQMMKKLGDVPAAHAERDVKASDDWQSFIRDMVQMRTDANLKKVQLKYIEMRFSEWQSRAATKRAEMKL